MSERINILQLRAKHVKSVREVAIDFEGNVHEIRGDSNQGKTTIIQSIRGGIEGLDKSMVQNGAESAEIQIVLDEATIQRIVSKDEDQDDKLMVTGADGKAMAKDKAKAFLKSIWGRGVFNPIRWVQLGNSEETKGRTERLREQRKQLLESLPLTLTDADVWSAVEGLGEPYARALEQVNLDGVDLEAQHPFAACKAMEEACYQFRALKNQQLEDAQNVLKLAPAPERMAPAESAEECDALVVSAREKYYTAKASMESNANLAEQAAKLRASIQAEDTALPKRAAAEKTAREYAQREEVAATVAQDLREQIAALQEQLKAQIEAQNEARSKREAAEALVLRHDRNDARKRDLAQLESECGTGEVHDLVALEKALAKSQADLEARKAQDIHDEAAAKAAKCAEIVEVFTGLVKLFRDTLPKKLLASAELGIEGLGVSEDCITVRGVPLHQLGTSEQIRIGVLVAAAVNPRSGFVLVDGAESMGSRDRRALAEAAKERGLTLIMTIVDDSAETLKKGSGKGVTVMKEFNKVERGAA